MRSRFAVAGVAAAALAVAWPAAARAKGPVASAAICGPAACVHVRGTAARTAIGRLFDQAGGISPRLAPFYRLRVRPVLPQTGFYVPSQDLHELHVRVEEP